MKEFEEKRKYIRFDSHLPVRFQLKESPSKFGHTLSRDISEGGMRLILNEFLRPKTELLLEMIILGRIINPSARIVWSQRISHSDNYQMGLEFLEMERIEKEKLKKYIDYKRESQENV